VLAGPQEGAVLAALYARARLVAFVPLLEGFGLPALEAMVACTPVVASAVPSTGDAALEVPPDDVGAIADALVLVASDEPTRARLVTAGLLRAGELSWEACARGHVAIWEEVSGG
jgi:glycosyltransferase involved in cell wall biosynthesis